MPKNKKKFIDKKNAVTFQLLHRSQRDPLVTDDKAPKRVLQPVLSKKERNDELEKFGIYFDDDYNYMQHLKPVSGELDLVETPVRKKEEKSNLVLPSSLFPSQVEEKVGVLNKAARQGLDLSMDPDVIAALDSDYECDSDFEDDFVLKLNASMNEGEESGENGTEEEEEDDEMIDELGSLENFDTKSRFTDYSMSSSVIRRNEQLRLLDDRFEEMFASYDDTEVGGLECEEIEGFVDPSSEMVMKCLDEFEKEMSRTKLEVERTEYHSDDESSESDNSLVEVKENEKWDCESILSTYSNIYNHPKLIEAPPSKIKINPKTGIPETKIRLTAKALAALEGEGSKATGPGSLASAVSLLSIRPKGEQPQERNERKKTFREHKKERRVEKKLNTVAFKEEKKRMEKMMANNKSSHIVRI